MKWLASHTHMPAHDHKEMNDTQNVNIINRFEKYALVND